MHFPLHHSAIPQIVADFLWILFSDTFYLFICLFYLFLYLFIYIYIYIYLFIFCCGAATQRGVMASSFLMFLDHTQRRTTVGRTPLDEWSARRSDLYLTTHNTHNRQTSMPPVGFEPKISAFERPQTHFTDRAATGTGRHILYLHKIRNLVSYLQTYVIRGKTAVSIYTVTSCIMED